jgi:hypothetical protein
VLTVPDEFPAPIEYEKLVMFVGTLPVTAPVVALIESHAGEPLRSDQVGVGTPRTPRTGRSRWHRRRRFRLCPVSETYTSPDGLTTTSRGAISQSTS